MSIHVALSHRTRYRYDRPVTLSPHIIRLRPAPHCRTPILSYSLKVEPRDAFPQLAAGPVRQLPGAAGVPGEDARADRRGRSRRRDDGHQPVRLLPRADGGDVSVRLRAVRWRRSWRRSWTPAPARRATLRACSMSVDRRRATRTIDFLVELNQQLSQRHRLRHPPGAGRADVRGDAGAAAAARAATPAGCWCRCCATSGWRRGSSPAT